jgi:hypothetical protein
MRKVQQDAAGGLGVSPNYLPIPQEWGIKGVENERTGRARLDGIIGHPSTLDPRFRGDDIPGRRESNLLAVGSKC